MPKQRDSKMNLLAPITQLQQLCPVLTHLYLHTLSPVFPPILLKQTPNISFEMSNFQYVSLKGKDLFLET